MIQHKTYVYFFYEKENELLVKIGFTRNLWQRKKNLKSPNGKPVDLIFYIEVVAEFHDASSKLGNKIEKLLHKKFNNCLFKGEWFSITKPILREFLFNKLSKHIDESKYNNFIKVRDFTKMVHYTF